jgi:RNA polymerase sigma factor (sigma-70 family)
MDARRPPMTEFFDLVQQGDRAATTEFVDRYGPVAHALLRSRFSKLSKEDCQELVQDVLVNVIASLPKYDRGQPFKPWFLTITGRRALDFIDKQAADWVEGELGSVPLHISFEDATAPDAPKSLKVQVLDATARDSAFEASVDTEAPSETGATTAGLTAKLTALGVWLQSRSVGEKAVLEHYMLGASWQEVAARLLALGQQVSPSTAAVRGHRLIAKARKELGQQLGDP